jgi:uncharacterized protein (TIGR00251 family)
LTHPGIRATGEEVLIDVRVIPRASKNEIVGWDETGRLRVRVTSPPVNGAANKALLKFLAGKLGVSGRRLRVSRGETSRHKTLALQGLRLEEVERILR